MVSLKKGESEMDAYGWYLVLLVLVVMAIDAIVNRGSKQSWFTRRWK
jgi:hypothetical protein